MNNNNNNWIPVAGSVIGALIGNIPGAIIGGVIGAIIKQVICPQCGNVMENIGGNIWRCKKCGFIINKG